MASSTWHCSGGTNGVGNVYYISEIGTVLLGVLSSISFSGDTRYEIAMSLGVLDSTGLNKVYFGLTSPSKDVHLSVICYATDFAAALQQMQRVFDNYILWRMKNPFQASPVEIQIYLEGNKWLKFKVMPGRLSIKPNTGKKVIDIDLSGALQAYEGAVWLGAGSSWKVE